MKPKIKIELKPHVDPPPFICSVCGVEREYWLLMHNGKHKVCARHYCKPIISNQQMRDFSWKDTYQIQAASLIIKELKNAK